MMEKTIFVLAVVNLCFFAVCDVIIAEESKGASEIKNLLKNSDFEEVTEYVIPEPEFKDSLPGITEIPKGYGINYASYPGKLTVIHDAETSHSGEKYIRLEKEPPAEIGFMCHSHAGRLRVNAGEKYLGSCWAKGTGKMHILAYAYSEVGGGKPTLDSGDMEMSSEGWKECKWEFTIPEGTAGIIFAFHAKGAVDIDDVGLFRIED